MARRRGWVPGGRPHGLSLALSDEELAVVSEAAAGVGMAPGAWVAQVACDVARGAVVPVPAGRREVLSALADAAVAVTRFGTNVNQAVARLHSTGEAGPALSAAVAACTRATESLDDAAVRVARMRG